MCRRRWSSAGSLSAGTSPLLLHHYSMESTRKSNANALLGPRVPNSFCSYHRKFQYFAPSSTVGLLRLQSDPRKMGTMSGPTSRRGFGANAGSSRPSNFSIICDYVVIPLQ
ncbi:hypothetical protein CLAIMM_05561 isoform 2 [Cladophialophora immunda]|nr:hypothetical protein CLAIMM_05561 isoform 2 [Cladophialophora immunda]